MDTANRLTLHIVKTAGKILFRRDADKLSLPAQLPYGIEPAGESFTIRASSADYIAVEASSPMLSLPEGYVLSGLREAFPLLDPQDYRNAGKAMQLLYWDTASKYCGKCGAPMTRATEISKKCTCCSTEVFAQVSPAIIVLVRRGREALLVHARNFTRPFFGLVAGFVETGETIEECVEREVREETSLTVKNVKYVASQSWPFPNSLMLGFTADYDSGQIAFADGELTEGGFFTPDNLPMLPPPPSIARTLIESWLAEVGTRSLE